MGSIQDKFILLFGPFYHQWCLMLTSPNRLSEGLYTSSACLPAILLQGVEHISRHPKAALYLLLPKQTTQKDHNPYMRQC